MLPRSLPWLSANIIRLFLYTLGLAGLGTGALGREALGMGALSDGGLTLLDTFIDGKQ